VTVPALAESATPSWLVREPSTRILQDLVIGMR
jgi:hypothetical protein